MMISWHTAPRHKYKGYVYKPDVDEYDDGNRKASHNVYAEGKENFMHTLPEFYIHASPYSFLSFEQFKNHVDKYLTGNREFRP